MSPITFFHDEYMDPTAPVGSDGQYTWTPEGIEAVEADPQWTEAVIAVVAFAENDASYMCDPGEDGSYYVVASVRDRQTANRLIARMVEIQADMSTRLPLELVNKALSWLALRNIKNDYPEGTDCDGVSHYEPHGRPPGMLTKPLARAMKAVQLRGLTDAELIAADRDWKAEREHNWQADNYYSIKLQDETRIPLDQVLGERGLGRGTDRGMSL